VQKSATHANYSGHRPDYSLSGRILNARGDLVQNALGEIWQVDNSGVYLHNGSHNAANRDRNFRGFGRLPTGSNNEYLCRTIKPVPYPRSRASVNWAARFDIVLGFTLAVVVAGWAAVFWHVRGSVARSIPGNSDTQSGCCPSRGHSDR
jgi:protocatechuate 3,4-dioxygenase beta subunit